MILRIEDLEKPANRKVLEDMLSDLHWLGLDWDEGPVWDGVETTPEGSVILKEKGPNGPYIQGSRRHLYHAIFEDLKNRGLIYPCVCTKAEFAASAQAAPHEGDSESRYPGICRGRFSSSEEAFAWVREQNPDMVREPVWRFMVPDGKVDFIDRFFGPQSYEVQRSIGDFVVFKNPDQPSYQLAVVADDMAMGVTEVVRGDDLLPSTARQIMLYKALGGIPPSYGHVPLVLGPDGKRIAKRHGDSRIRTYRERGVDPRHLIGVLADWSGIASRGPVSPSELVGEWDWSRMRKDRIILDAHKHRELSGEGTSTYHFEVPL